ncbi:hypothetical protein M231_05770 [Tremella mesenterica]|uniref:Uncharacterized protein n=1 Tax=Tremella mesenterica TaxID=5217 RepID=A0A4V1M3I0_TREME|nr:hypothetical protein M231_05770 [Tremella mesenterica]
MASQQTTDNWGNTTTQRRLDPYLGRHGGEASGIYRIDLRWNDPTSSWKSPGPSWVPKGVGCTDEDSAGGQFESGLRKCGNTLLRLDETIQFGNQHTPANPVSPTFGSGHWTWDVNVITGETAPQCRVYLGSTDTPSTPKFGSVPPERNLNRSLGVAGQHLPHLDNSSGLQRSLTGPVVLPYEEWQKRHSPFPSTTRFTQLTAPWHEPMGSEGSHPPCFSDDPRDQLAWLEYIGFYREGPLPTNNAGPPCPKLRLPGATVPLSQNHGYQETQDRRARHREPCLPVGPWSNCYLSSGRKGKSSISSFNDNSHSSSQPFNTSVQSGSAYTDDVFVNKDSAAQDRDQQQSMIGTKRKLSLSLQHSSSESESDSSPAANVQERYSNARRRYMGDIFKGTRVGVSGVLQEGRRNRPSRGNTNGRGLSPLRNLVSNDPPKSRPSTPLTVSDL